MNEFIYKYLAPKRQETELPDGRQKVVTANFAGLSTPEGEVVASRFIGDTMQPWKGSTRYFLDDQPYEGTIIVTFGPETTTEIIPRWRPYDPANGNPGGH